VIQNLSLSLSLSVDVTLDPNKAHPELTLSEDGKQVGLGNIKHDYPHNYKRFDKCIVLGKEGFSSGRFYFEVQVKGITQWCLVWQVNPLPGSGICTRVLGMEIGVCGKVMETCIKLVILPLCLSP